MCQTFTSFKIFIKKSNWWTSEEGQLLAKEEIALVPDERTGFFVKFFILSEELQLSYNLMSQKNAQLYIAKFLTFQVDMEYLNFIPLK